MTRVLELELVPDETPEDRSARGAVPVDEVLDEACRFSEAQGCARMNSAA